MGNNIVMGGEGGQSPRILGGTFYFAGDCRFTQTLETYKHFKQSHIKLKIKSLCVSVCLDIFGYVSLHVHRNEVLTMLFLWPGETFGVKEPLKISTPRTLNHHKKIQEVSDQEAKQITEATKGNQNPQSRKCHGKGCPNQKKKDCDNYMCGRCCRNSGESCDAHEDAFDVYIPPSYESSHKFHKVEPSAHFENRKKFEEFISVKKPVR